MCYRPLHISSNAAYFNSNVSASYFDVPCGKCEACRDQYRSMWKCRLWHELEATYSNGGCAVFLTFTYNDANLPVLALNGVVLPVFNHEHVKTFLNRLKIRMYRKYGRGAYKYFIAMEYGKNTKRQHLHGLFFLSSAVDYVFFCELCRELWTYGYTFPKYDKRTRRYVDDDGNDNSPLIRSRVKGSIYISKYVTKDLDYYGLPNVAEAFKADVTLSRIYGPKHFQSNNIGISILDKLNLSDKDSVLRFLSDGISVPYALDTRIPVPRYIRTKLLRANVPSERIGRNGSVLFDSVPTVLAHSLGTLLYERKHRDMHSSIAKVFARYKSLVPSFVEPKGFDMDVLCNYILYFKNVSNNVLHSFAVYYDGDFSAFADSSKVGYFYTLSKDNSFLKANQFCTDCIHDDFPYSSVFSPALLSAYRVYCRASSYCEEHQVKEFYKRSEERDRVRQKYFYKFNKKLC